jgi:MFS family permease
MARPRSNETHRADVARQHIRERRAVAGGALGPYLNVFLVIQQHWSQSEVGVVTTISGLLELAVQTPIGAAIDETSAKRGAIVLALALLGIGAIIIFVWPTFWPVLIANSLIAIVGDVFGPAVAAVTLGLYARSQLARRMGRNSAFDMRAMWPSPW